MTTSRRAATPTHAKVLFILTGVLFATAIPHAIAAAVYHWPPTLANLHMVTPLLVGLGGWYAEYKHHRAKPKKKRQKYHTDRALKALYAAEMDDLDRRLRNMN